MINKGQCPIRDIYVALVIYIIITGYQEKPLENKRNPRAKREAIQRAMENIRERKPFFKMPGINTLEMLIGRFLIPKSFYKELSERFCSFIVQPGRALAGDEKLLKFLGDSALVRMVKTKPDQIGFWFYQLMARFSNQDFFLLYARAQDSCSEVDESIPTLEIIKEWGQIIQNFKVKNDNEGAILVNDSYYTTEAGRNWLNEGKIKFISAIATNRFPVLMDALALKGQQVTKPGQTAAIILPNTGELFVHHWDPDVNIDKKHVLSNAFTLAPRTRRAAVANIPVYPYYKFLFNGCDKFNRELHDRKYCHRSGGGTKRGEKGHVHKFYMACIIKNVHTLRDQFCSEEEKNKDFLLKCIELAFDIVNIIDR
jgi:hypothetical protein